MKTPSDFRYAGKDLENLVMDCVRNAERRYTPVDVERALCSKYGISFKNVRRAVKNLIAENRLVYTQFLGHTFLEISYNRPVHVGGGIILAPPDASAHASPGQTVIRIAPGAAFGMGDHATTRIALQLIAWSLNEKALIGNPPGARALDIGTGSGVLAIAACLMGMGEAAGIDLDPCARVEAEENVGLNHLSDRVRISNDHLDAVGGDYSLILANLRYPTLAQLRDQILNLCTGHALLILSGFREHELPALLAEYGTDHFRHVRTLVENAWAGVVLMRIH